MNGGLNTLGRPATPPEIRFERFVDRTETCWGWLGFIDRDGYGVFHHPETKRAHRASYLMSVGVIPLGMVIDHLCRNRGCVNPEHLEAVTIRENTLRGDTLPAANVVKTHCPKGHPYSGDNLVILEKQRACRVCRAKAVAEYDARNRDKRRDAMRERRNRKLRPEHSERTH